MSGYLRIGGALLVGSVLILAAFAFVNTPSTQQASVILSVAPERNYIETTDTDGDGVDDWEEELSVKISDSIVLPEAKNDETAHGTYENPTTFTGKFAQAFFSDYINGKVSSSDLVDKDALVKNALGIVESNTQSRIFTRAEILTVSDSPETLREYGNQIARIIQKHSIDNENEALIVERALNENDPAVLEELAPIKTVYERILADTLLIATPDSFAREQIALLSTYEAIRMDIEAMELTFTDPLYALARIKRYQEDATALYQSLTNIGSKLIANEVRYEKDEPGALFYLLNI